jgi:hypothetical protein
MPKNLHPSEWRLLPLQALCSGMYTMGMQNFRLRISYLEEFHTIISQKQLSVETATGLKICKPGEETHLSCYTDPRRKITCYILKKYDVKMVKLIKSYGSSGIKGGYLLQILCMKVVFM